MIFQKMEDISLETLPKLDPDSCSTSERRMLCFCCLTWVDKSVLNLDVLNNSSQQRQLCKKFLQFAKDYLQVSPKVFSKLASIIQTGGNDKDEDDEETLNGEDQQQFPLFCVDCENAVIVICNLYGRLQEIRLKLANKIGALGEGFEKTGNEHEVINSVKSGHGSGSYEEKLTCLAEQLKFEEGKDGLHHIRSHMKNTCRLRFNEKGRNNGIITSPVKRKKSNDLETRAENSEVGYVADTPGAEQLGKIRNSPQKGQGQSVKKVPRNDGEYRGALNNASKKPAIDYSQSGETIIIGTTDNQSFIDESDNVESIRPHNLDGRGSTPSETETAIHSIPNLSSSSQIIASPQQQRPQSFPDGMLNPEEIPSKIPQLPMFFKQRRIQLGLSHTVVCSQLASMCGLDEFRDPTTVSQFENMSMKVSMMEKLKHYFRMWLIESRPAPMIAVPPSYPPNYTPNVCVTDSSYFDIDALIFPPTTTVSVKPTLEKHDVDAYLENYYQRNPDPDHESRRELATKLNVNKDKLRKWFTKRRLRDK